MLWQSQAMLFVIMICRRKTTQVNGHQRYGATAIFRHIKYTTCSRAIWLRRFAGAKIVTCSPAMRLRQYASHGNMLAMAICRLWQYSGAKICNLLVCRLHQLAGASFDLVPNGCAMRKWSARWLCNAGKSHPMAAQCVEQPPKGGMMLK